MGDGEDVIHSWQAWFAGLNDDQAGDYFLHYPPPEDWRDWCEYFSNSRKRKNG
jgi:hypothetical protein